MAALRHARRYLAAWAPRTAGGRCSFSKEEVSTRTSTRTSNAQPAPRFETLGYALLTTERAHATRQRGRRAFAGIIQRLVGRSVRAAGAAEREGMGRATSLVLHLIRRRRRAAAEGAAVYRRLADSGQGGGEDATRPRSPQRRADKRRRRNDDDAAAVALRRRRVKKKREAPDAMNNTRVPQTDAAATGTDGKPGGVPEVESARLRCPMGHALIRHTRGMALRRCVGGGGTATYRGAGGRDWLRETLASRAPPADSTRRGLCEAKAGGREERSFLESG